MSKQSARLAELRQHIEKLEGRGHARDILPFGLKAIDTCLPGGGLALGALHEMAGAGQGAMDGVAAALFAAGIAARTSGQVIWCLSQPDLFAPGLAQVGLPAERLIQVEGGDEKTVLACCEEALRHKGVGAVVGEVSRLSLTTSRRLQLAAEETRSLCLIVRRWGREKDAAVFGTPNAAMTRWRVTPLASQALPVCGMGCARWRLELMRCKGGEPALFDVEACDAQGRLALAAPLVHRPAAAADEQGYAGFRAAS